MSILFSVNGRANRARFWCVNLVVVGLGAIVFSLVFTETAFSLDPESLLASVDESSLPMLLLFLPLSWVGLAIAVKRWHDRNKSGWWVLVIFLPVIGAVWHLIECGFLCGTVGPNKYGQDPLRGKT